jgi:hypothetical protein
MFALSKTEAGAGRTPFGLNAEAGACGVSSFRRAWAGACGVSSFRRAWAGACGARLSMWTIQLLRSSKNAQASNTLAKRAASSLPRGPASRQKETADARYARGAWVHTARRASGPAGRRAAPAASTAHPRPAPRSKVFNRLSLKQECRLLHPLSLDACTRLLNIPSPSRWSSLCASRISTRRFEGRGHGRAGARLEKLVHGREELCNGSNDRSNHVGVPSDGVRGHLRHRAAVTSTQEPRSRPLCAGGTWTSCPV